MVGKVFMIPLETKNEKNFVEMFCKKRENLGGYVGENSNEILNFKKIVIKRGIEMGAMRCMV